MSVPTLEIKKLSCKVEQKTILKGVDLTLRGGEIHVIMGPNGTGKSTLASVLMGHPNFTVTGGQAQLNGADLLAMSVDERARAGLFLAMQYPAEISGVTNAEFLRTAINSRLGSEQKMGLFPFRKAMREAVALLEMNESLPERYLNEGFSGGEKKRNEILQMMMLKPSFAILDEIDSGLDIDALRIVGQNVTRLAKEQGEAMGVLLITHYQRLLDYVKPDFVHVMMAGRIVYSGGPELALKLEREGYDWLNRELGLPENVSDSALEDEIEALEQSDLLPPPLETALDEKGIEKEIFSDGLDIMV